MPNQYPIELRQRALRLLAEARQQEQYDTEWAAIVAVAGRVGVNSETLRKWLRRSETDAGARPGTTSEELAEIRRLKGRTPSCAAPMRSCGRRRRFSRPNSTGRHRDDLLHR